MTENDVRRELTLLSLSYPEYFRPMSREDRMDLLRLWTEILVWDDPEKFHAAVLEAIRQSKWMPKLQEICQYLPPPCKPYFTAEDYRNFVRTCKIIQGREDMTDEEFLAYHRSKEIDSSNTACLPA